MRRALLVTIAVLLLASVQSIALQAHPRPPFRGFGRPPQAAPPPKAGQEPAIIDATSLGSPLVLDKGWRVGISSDAGAANPGFDDSHWAVRDGTGTIADVAEPGEDSDRPDHEDKYAWFRLHLKLPPNHAQEALLIELPPDDAEQFSIEQPAVPGPGMLTYTPTEELILPEGSAPRRDLQLSADLATLQTQYFSLTETSPHSGDSHPLYLSLSD